MTLFYDVAETVQTCHRAKVYSKAAFMSYACIGMLFGPVPQSQQYTLRQNADVRLDSPCRGYASHALLYSSGGGTGVEHERGIIAQ